MRSTCSSARVPVLNSVCDFLIGLDDLERSLLRDLTALEGALYRRPASFMALQLLVSRISFATGLDRRALSAARRSFCPVCPEAASSRAWAVLAVMILVLLGFELDLALRVSEGLGSLDRNARASFAIAISISRLCISRPGGLLLLRGLRAAARSQLISSEQRSCRDCLDTRVARSVVGL